MFGLLVIVLALLPNFVFARKEHQGRVDDIDTCSAGICLLQMVSYAFMYIALILVRMPRYTETVAIIAGVVLLLYYCVWLRYFKDGCYYPDLYLRKFWGIPVPMTTFKMLYFVLASVWLCNGIALVFAIIYGVCDILNAKKAARDLKLRRYV